MKIDEVLKGVVIKQQGKPIEGEPVSDNHQVHPIAGGAFVQANGQDVVATLKAAYPKCLFTWFATPVKVKAAKDSKDDKDPKPSDEKKD